MEGWASQGVVVALKEAAGGCKVAGAKVGTQGTAADLPQASGS